MIFLIFYLVSQKNEKQETNTESSSQISPGKLETYKLDSTGETILHISGKEWVVAINLSKFDSAEYPVPSMEQQPTRFLYQESKNLALSIFGEEFIGFDTPKCRNYYLPGLKEAIAKAGLENLEIQNRGDKVIAYYGYPTINPEIHSLNYFYYYDDYCFDFHITTLNKNVEIEEAYEIFDSIRMDEFKPNEY